MMDCQEAFTIDAGNVRKARQARAKPGTVAIKPDLTPFSTTLLWNQVTKEEAVAVERRRTRKNIQLPHRNWRGTCDRKAQ